MLSFSHLDGGPIAPFSNCILCSAFVGLYLFPFWLVIVVVWGFITALTFGGVYGLSGIIVQSVFR